MLYIRYKGKKYFIKDGTLRLRYKGIKHITEVEELDKLTDLRSLDLSRNKITEIKGLDKLTNLKVLNLSWNKINEIEGVCNLINLNSLILRGNNVSVIKGIESLINLRKLILSDNRITQFNQFKSFINLRELNLSRNKITEIKGLEKLKNLHKLNLYNNEINEIKGLEKLNNLQELNLSRNEITEIKGLNNLEDLKLCYLDWNQINDINGFETLTNLEVLDLSGNNIKKIRGFDSLINLKKLILYENNIIEIEGLNSLTNLEVLSLSRNKINEIMNLDKLINLKKLDLWGNNITEIKGLKKNIKLKYLNLENNDITDGKEFVKLLNYGKIEHIEIYYHKLKFVHPEDQAHIINFLKESYRKYNNKFNEAIQKPPYAKPSKSYLTKLLDKMISIANILINLYHSEWEKDILFNKELKNRLEKRISLEKKGSIDYFKLQALKNVLFAGMEITYIEQVYYLKEAINNFKKAGIVQCEFFYQVHFLLIKCLIAHSKGDLEDCKNYIKNILNLYQKYENINFNISIKNLINELSEIQKNLINYTIEPEHLERLIKISSKKCDKIIKNAFPQLQYSQPGIYRILYHIVNNMRESWQRVYSKRNKYKFWHLRTKKKIKKIWREIYNFLNELDLNYFPRDFFEKETKLNLEIYKLLNHEFLNINLNKSISGRIHVDLSNDSIAIEIKKLESNTAKDELIGQIIEDIRIGDYKFGIIFGIDISSKRDLTKYNKLFFGEKGNIYCIIKAFPY